MQPELLNLRYKNGFYWLYMQDKLLLKTDNTDMLDDIFSQIEDLIGEKLNFIKQPGDQ